MIILGIDPGTIVMGFGLIDCRDNNAALITYGAIKTKQSEAMGERLGFLYKELNKVIKKQKPDVLAVERPFVAKNIASALAIGRAQAVAMVAAAVNGIPSYEYTPAQIKQRVTNYGASSKDQIQQMVRLQLGLAEIPEPNDAADALAVALCHMQEEHLKRLLAENSQ